MKKIITTLIIGPILVGAAFLAYRHNQNISSVVPYPYTFKESAYANLDSDAPILIIGDRLGVRLSSFADIMAKKVSENLSKPIRIDSIATKGEGLHRTLEKVKSLRRLPLIVIYLGGSEETRETKFKTRDIATIDKNLALYKDERVQTLLMIFPSLSRFVYFPVDYQKLGTEILDHSEKPDETITLRRNGISFKLYEQEINDLFTYVKDHNSYMIAVSAPLNLDAKPRSSCPGSFSEQLRPKLDEVIKLVGEKDFKQAYNISKELSLMANNNARTLYIHGQISKRLGKIDEAQRHLEMAAAFDCKNWRGSPVFNEILKAAAQKHDVAFFDFHKMLKDNWTQNVVFFDDIYPQNLYMEKMSNAIAAKIKKLLKL